MDPNIRGLFPVARSHVYLNCAAIGPLPTVTVDAITAHLHQVASSGSAGLNDWIETKVRVRRLVATMLGVAADDIAFTRNTTDGLCAVAAGLDWRSGDNIVSLANEFPANYYPWRRLRDERGVELRLCPERNGRYDTDELCSMIDGRTRLVAVSAIQYATGFRIDLERVGQAARASDALLAADIIQAFGAVPLDLISQNVDIAAGAGYKWLCAPEGTGIFYVGPRAREHIRPVSNGWTCVERPWEFADREQAFAPGARGWETGMGGTALLCGLEASLRLLLWVGIERVAKRLGELTDHLCDIVPGDRFQIVSSRSSGEGSQIVSLLPLNGTYSADEIAERLARKGVVVSSRGGLLRIAPHFFNTFDDIERFAASLP